MAFRYWTISDTTPAAASTVAGDEIGGFDEYDWIRIDADLVGATGGALDVYLQRLIKPGAWSDYIHFAQLASGAVAIRYSAIGSHGLSTTITTSNISAQSPPTVSLAAATFLGGHPGKVLRAVYVAGAGTSAGALVNIYISGFRSDR